MATAEDLPDGLEELKQLVLKMGRRMKLTTEQMAKLEESVSQLVTQLDALMRHPDAPVTLETLGNNLIEMTGILNSPETGLGEGTVGQS